MNSILQDVENGFKFLGKLFSDIVNAMWNTAKQQLMTDATNIFSQAAVQLQNEQPGLTDKQMAASLLSKAESLLVGDLSALIWGEVVTVVGVVVTDLNVASTPGNAGNLPAGNTGPTTS